MLQTAPAAFQLQGNAAAYFECQDREVLNESGARTGKGEPLWATVWTPTGPREIGSLSVGDRALGGNGRATVVEEIHELGERDIYRVEFSTGEEVFCTKDHMWGCLHPQNHETNEVVYSVVETGELIERLNRNPRLDWWVPQAVAQFDPVELPLHPYAVGVLLGDGGLTQGSVRFTKVRRDAEVVERVRRHWPTLSTASDGVTHFLPGAAVVVAPLGILGKKSIEKHIPEVYRRGSVEERLELLRGLMDTDGTVDKKTGMPRFGSSSRQLAADFLEVIQSLGGAGRLEAKESWLDGVQHADHWNVWFRYDDGPSLFHLTRKKELARVRKKFKVRRFFRKIESLGAPEPARCIKVANADGLFLTDGFVVTHNTHSELLKAYFTAEMYPGSRQLFARETRKSLTETVLPDWENKILGRGHPAIGRAKRNNRDAYHFPNGSDIVLHGLDDPENILSGEFDRFYVFQAEQLPTSDAWDALLSRLSGSATPYVQATADANPGSERHWLIRRVAETLCLACSTLVESIADVCPSCGSTALGRMRHFEYRHSDNPLWFDWEKQAYTKRGEDYLTQVLGRLRGVRRKRLLEHKWVSEEGQVLEDWDPAIHRVAGRLEQNRDMSWTLQVTSPGWVVGSKDPMREARVQLDWFGAGCDWGFRPAPGVLQVWGYDRYGRRFRVAEVYRVGQQMEWWAGIAEALYREFQFRYIACDPSANALIEAFNIRLGPISGRSGPMLAIGADNTIRRQKPDLAGIDLMRWGLRDPDGIVRTFLVKDALRYGTDPELRDANLPTCTEDEVPEWVFDKRKGSGEVLENPVKRNDHGLDAWRYEAGEGWGRRGAATGAGAPKYPEGSAGAVHNHAEKMAKARAWSRANGQP